MTGRKGKGFQNTRDNSLVTPVTGRKERERKGRSNTRDNSLVALVTVRKGMSKHIRYQSGKTSDGKERERKGMSKQTR